MTQHREVVLVGKNLPANARDTKTPFRPLGGEGPGGGHGNLLPVFLPGESHEQRNLVGCSS